MQIYRFDRETAHPIRDFGSLDTFYARVASKLIDATVGVIYFAPGGSVGYHPAVGDQLFMVVEGSGWIAGADHQQVKISTGQAAYWKSGEWHEAGSHRGMSVITVEAENILPALKEA